MRRIFLFLLVFLAFSSISLSQDKALYNPEILDLGDCKILSALYKESDTFVSQEFKVEVPAAGKYYLAAWLISGIDIDGDMLEYRILINENKQEYIVKTDESGPCSLNLKEQLLLTAGSNTISIKTKKPHCPNIEFIKLSTDKQNNSISDEKYNFYIDKISENKLPENYTDIKKAAIEEQQSELGLKSYQLENPQGNYDHEMDVDFSYSFSALIYLEAGRPYIFETKNATTDPVLHILNNSTTINFSRTDDDSGVGNNAKLTFTAPYSGIFRVFVRKNGNPASVDGICDIYFSGYMGGTYIEDILFSYHSAVSGTEVLCPKSVTESMNWFTSYLTGDSRIWIVNSESPGKIVAQNDDWTGESDFNWGNASRIRANLNISINSIVVSSDSYSPEGNCDLYMNCKNSNVLSSFPNLLALDAIQSAPASSQYNCISWSGGSVALGSNFWPPAFGNNWEAISYRGTAVHDIRSFDNFYMNKNDAGDPLPRHQGQNMNYYNVGQDPTDALVALWGFGEEDYTHASVKKPSNSQPHGYDWESKAGPQIRMFHPRDALYGNVYGNIRVYYRWTGGYTYSESSLKSTSTNKPVELSIIKQDVLKNMVNSNSGKSKFDELYKLWVNTWSSPELIIQSNPRIFSRSNEYKSLLKYCKSEGSNSWPLVFDKYISGDKLNMLLIEDLTRNEYSWLMEEIKHITQKSASIHPMATQNANYVYYIGVLMEQLQNVRKTEFNGFETIDINLYPNPAKDVVNIEINGIKQSYVYVNICDLTGKVVLSTKESFIEFIKTDIISININNLPIGVYICKVIADREVISKLFYIQN